MNIPPKKLGEFIQLFKEKTGITLSEQEALARAEVLLRTVSLVYKPVRKTDYNRYHSDCPILFAPSPTKTKSLKFSGR